MYRNTYLFHPPTKNLSSVIQLYSYTVILISHTYYGIHKPFARNAQQKNYTGGVRNRYGTSGETGNKEGL